MNEKISKNEYGNRLFEIIMTGKPVNKIVQINRHENIIIECRC